MKVCMVNSFYPPWIGGAERYVSSLSKELVKRGNDVTVYCSGRPLDSGESIEEGVKVRRMRTAMMLYGTPLVMFPPSFLAERYDVIHANFPSPFLAAISSAASTLKGTPSVLTWHNDLPAVTSGARLLVGLHDAVAPAYLDGFQRIIATTHVYARSSKLLRGLSDKVTVILNGVDTTKFNPNVNGDSIKKMYDLRGDKIVLFVGALTRWHSYKGLDVLLKAFKTVKTKQDRVKLIVVGDGPMRGGYENLVREHGLERCVIFAGRVDDMVIPLYYAICDILVLPSKDSSEGFGLVLLEAMATGKAVIGSRVGGVLEVIRDGENGVTVEPNDPDALAVAMLLLLLDDKLRRVIGTYGRRFAESHDWSRVADQVERLYSGLQ